MAMKTNYDIQNMDVSYLRDARKHGVIPENKPDLVARVRSGDMAAREELILSFYRYCSLQASRYSKQYGVEYVDLAQIAMLVVIEHLDQALEKTVDPFPYLFLSVKRALLKTVPRRIPTAFRRGLGGRPVPFDSYGIP